MGHEDTPRPSYPLGGGGGYGHQDHPGLKVFEKVSAVAPQPCWDLPDFKPRHGSP